MDRMDSPMAGFIFSSLLMLCAGTHPLKNTGADREPGEKPVPAEADVIKPESADEDSVEKSIRLKKDEFIPSWQPPWDRSR